MLKTVLVILTLAPDGSTHLSLASASDAADCDHRRAAVEAMVQAAGTPVIATRCGETGQGFTPYDRQAKQDDFVHPWRVQLAEDGPVLQPIAEGDSCAEDRRAMQPSYCAVSAQAAVHQAAD